VTLQRLSIAHFRNLQSLDLAVPAGLVAVVGANGAGKTSLLEAVAVLGNLGSFRAPHASSWFQHGSSTFEVNGGLRREGAEVTISVRAKLGRRVFRQLMRGARRLSPAEYLTVFPVAVLSAGDRQLIWGAPEGRRRFLDRLAFHLKPEAYAVLQRYRRALHQRNALLPHPGTDAQIEAFERDLATLGAGIAAHRLAALSRLEEALHQELSILGWSLSRPVLRYNSPDGMTLGGTAEMAGRLRVLLARSRRIERARGHTVVGPHRHDLEFSVRGVPAREVLSAGQGKLLATALKLAVVGILEETRGRPPMVVFDDIDAELDAGALGRVVARLSGRGQGLLSSAHEAMLVPCLHGAAVWRVQDGTIEGASYEGAEA
jgi:DNA replication and repair protein RecF